MRRLTKRQKEVLACFSEGMNAKKSGKHLGLSDRTVHAYLTVIRQKMDAKNTAHAIYKGAKAGII